MPVCIRLSPFPLLLASKRREFATGHIFHQRLLPAPRIDFRLLVSRASALLLQPRTRGQRWRQYCNCNLVFAIFRWAKRKKKYPKRHPTLAPPRSPSLIVPPTPSYLPKIRIVRPMVFKDFFFPFSQFFKRWEETKRAISWNYT